MTLIVIDDAVLLEDVEAILNLDAGMLIAKNGARALFFVTFVDFSVAIVDLDLPRDSGFDIIRSIRGACPALPIIAMSDVYSRDVLENAKSVGAEEVLEKPATAEWNPIVERLRRKSQAQKAAHN